MFRGLTELSLDEKGRVTIPSRYRSLLQESPESQCILTIDIDASCLLLYPFAHWERIEKQIESLPSFEPQSRKLQRLFIGHAVELSLDKLGRILVPPPLREFAQLQKEVVLLGQGKKLELWGAEKWQRERQQWLSEETKDLTSSLLSISI